MHTRHSGLLTFCTDVQEHKTTLKSSVFSFIENTQLLFVEKNACYSFSFCIAYNSTISSL